MVSLKLKESQQYFLQVMINKKVIDHYKFKTFFNQILAKFKIEIQGEYKEFYTNFIREINDCIRHFNMEIKMAICELTTITYFVLIKQCESSQIATLSSLYSPIELKIFRSILDSIVHAENGVASLDSIVRNVMETFESMSQNQTQRDSESMSTQTETRAPSVDSIKSTIEKFIQDCWLMDVSPLISNARRETDLIGLHCRSIAELSQYLKELYENKEEEKSEEDEDEDESLSYCCMCKMLVIAGSVKCSHCPIQMHRSCAKNVFKSVSKECPSCRQNFEEEKIAALKEDIKFAKENYCRLNQCQI